MRLIDADKLIRTVRFLTLRDGKEIEIHYVEVERIDSAPTIDAVPVDLINRIIEADGTEDQSNAISLLSLIDTWKYVKNKRREGKA